MENKFLNRKQSKIINLNFKMKNNIFSYLPIDNIMSNLIFINKNINKSLKKSDILKIIKEICINYHNEEIYKKINFNFSSKNLMNFLEKIEEKKILIENNHIDYMIEIYLYFLQKKYENFKKLFLNNINELNLNILSKFLMKNNISLTILNLSRNKIGLNESDMQFLSNGLEKNLHLKEIYLNNNLIGLNKDDAKYLSIIIEKNISLIILSLGKNQIGKKKMMI